MSATVSPLALLFRMNRATSFTGFMVGCSRLAFGLSQ